MSSPSAPRPLSRPLPWDSVREQLRARGQRWTPQRRALVQVLAESHGHVTGSELVERCRAIDPATVPSTVYRTLGVLEELGLVRHSHGHDGREEFHVLPEAEHGHVHCTHCGRTWELPLSEVAGLVDGLQERRGFQVDVSHLSIGGLCPDCRRLEGDRAKGHAHPNATAAGGAATPAFGAATPAGGAATPAAAARREPVSLRRAAPRGR